MERVNAVRFARVARAGAAVIAAASGGACAAAALDPAPPAPRAAWSARGVDVRPMAPVEIGLVGSVRGRIRLLADSVETPGLGLTVVLLQRRSSRAGAGRSSSRSTSGDTVRLVSRSPRFEPRFRALRGGQPVLFVNEGPLKHRIFSTDVEPRSAIDLEPESEAGPLVLEPTGPIRFFCSLHPDETFVVFAARADHLALPDSRGAFRFPAVPSDRYTLSIWSEAVHGPVREIEVSGAGVTETVVWIDPRLIRP